MVLSNFGAAFEAIVMGGHRIDIARKLATLFAVAEAVGIILALHFGFGLFAMAVVMALSEVGFVISCYVASKKVLPQIQLSREYVTRATLPELFRYAGSYQLVNVMEVVYAAIIPIALLRVFGGEAAGVYALASRLQVSAQMVPDAFLFPILSGGAMAYSSGCGNAMQKLIDKAFKATLVLTLFPLGFIAVFGTSIIYAWTGQKHDSLQLALWLLCIQGFFYSFSLLGLVLYRTSGRALHDNIRQVLRIMILLAVSSFAGSLGFLGVLAGLACSEMAGMIFMIFALMKTYPGFRVLPLFPQTLKLAFATAVTLSAGIFLSSVPVHGIYSPRITAAISLALAIAGCLLAAGPALWLSKSVNRNEGKAVLQVVLPRRFRPA
jgi:O-antigen/teichoic acid export membrane protein